MQDMQDDNMDMNEDYDFIKEEEGEESELVSTTLVANTKKTMMMKRPVRTQEEYESFIESKYPETHYHADGTEYTVIVTVLKPEVNELEGLHPVYAWQTRG